MWRNEGEFLPEATSSQSEYLFYKVRHLTSGTLFIVALHLQQTLEDAIANKMFVDLEGNWTGQSVSS
jgi:membrane-associated PAP2 superfamily phosphatase